MVGVYEFYFLGLRSLNGGVLTRQDAPLSCFAASTCTSSSWLQPLRLLLPVWCVCLCHETEEDHDVIETLEKGNKWNMIVYCLFSHNLHKTTVTLLLTSLCSCLDSIPHLHVFHNSTISTQTKTRTLEYWGPPQQPYTSEKTPKRKSVKFSYYFAYLDISHFI